MIHNNYFREEPRRANEPRLIGDIITEMFRGNSPLAENRRKFFATKETDAEKGGMRHE